MAPIGETLAGAGAQLAVTLSVRDSAALLDALPAGAGRSLWRAADGGHISRRHLTEPGRLRIAFMLKPVGGEPLDPELVAAVERTADLLAELGHHVEEAAPGYDAAAMGMAFGTVMSANTWTNIQLRAAGRVPGTDDLEPVTRATAERGRQITADGYIRAVQVFHRTGRQLGAFFETHDVLLSPTIARTSLPLGVVRMDGDMADSFDRHGRRWWPSRRCATLPACRPCRCPWRRAARGCRSACISWRASVPRRYCIRWRRSSNERAVAQPEATAIMNDRIYQAIVAGFVGGCLSVLVFHQSSYGR